MDIFPPLLRVSSLILISYLDIYFFSFQFGDVVMSCSVGISRALLSLFFDSHCGFTRLYGLHFGCTWMYDLHSRAED